MELDNKIRDLIERNVSSDLKGITPEATPKHRNSTSPKVKIFLSISSHYILNSLFTKKNLWGQSPNQSYTSLMAERIK
jgi:hypothetical protein